jgi:transcriptional regulator with XRE-family HTH domain
MARPNRRRSIEGESNLARRVQREREYRGMSYETLAKAMTAAGCSIQASAIFKIEKGDPPRRITVDELVAFADVFEVEIDDLLTPVEVLRTQRGKKILQEIDDADGAFIVAVDRLMNSYSEYFDLAAYEPDMREYIDNHRFGVEVADEKAHSPILSVEIDGNVVEWDDTELRKAIQLFYVAVVESAGSVAEAAVEVNNQRRK